jgi:hypothetical protein
VFSKATSLCKNIFVTFFFFYRTGDRTWGLVLARQELYHLSHTPALLVFIYLFLLAYINYTKGFIVIFSYMHAMCYDLIHLLCCFFLPLPPCFLASF